MHTAYIIDAIRTPVGKRNGVLASVRPDDMFAHCLTQIIQRNPTIDINRIEDVIVGCAMPEGPQGLNVARISALLAGLPETVSGMTINRFCSSGIQSVALAADRIRLGEADLMLAGGTESMSQIPMMGNNISINLRASEDEHVGIAYGMGLTAEKVAKMYDISRSDQDTFALRSNQRACQAHSDGAFNEEIAPVTIKYNKVEDGILQAKEYVVEHDQGPRCDTSLAALAKLKPVFAKNGSVTAGNSSQMSDGAAAILLASEQAVRDFNLKPKAIFHGYSVAGVPPEIMGIGPVKAIPKVLKLTGYSINDFDWIELNEAFAAQSLAVIRELGLDEEKVNPQGGAIALGHPLGATGAIRLATLISAMQRRNQCRLGMVTMCIGTGMGAAGVIEKI